MSASLGGTNWQNWELLLFFRVVLYFLISRFVQLHLNEWLNARVKRGTFKEKNKANSELQLVGHSLRVFSNPLCSQQTLLQYSTGNIVVVIIFSN